MSSPSPRCEAGDILETVTERRLLVVAVGAEVYFVAEPLESAWAFEGCEETTARIGRDTQTPS
ncbi:hypothetical protein AB0F92_34130 [Kitasatospora aureofaciens]|uniref:hypothetical protein n=1 Tax=Kitasatospora aureofaciens TaxID=1894 RepID=UPI0033C0411E